MHLLTTGNAKTLKGVAYNVNTGILHLSPHTIASKKTICPKSTPGCRDSCLYTAGRGVMPQIDKARQKRTWLFHNDRAKFFELLTKDIQSLEKNSPSHFTIAIRLNGTSDIYWPGIKQWGDMRRKMGWQRIRFYDYTKLRKPIEYTRHGTFDYHLTFSRSEENTKDCLWAIKYVNVAVVFKGFIPATFTFKGSKTIHDVISGDETDLRFLDQGPGKVIGLTAKGKAKKDTTGFVVDNRKGHHYVEA